MIYTYQYYLIKLQMIWAIYLELIFIILLSSNQGNMHLLYSKLLVSLLLFILHLLIKTTSFSTTLLSVKGSLSLNLLLVASLVSVLHKKKPIQYTKVVGIKKDIQKLCQSRQQLELGTVFWLTNSMESRYKMMIMMIILQFSVSFSIMAIFTRS